MFILLFLVIAVACTATHPAFQPSESDLSKINTADSKVTLDELKKGYNLYVTNCGGCHWLPSPASKSKTEWEKIFPEMFSKIALSPEQQKLIRQYVYSKL